MVHFPYTLFKRTCLSGGCRESVCATVFLSSSQESASLRRSSKKMHKPIKYAEKALTYAAGAAWFVFDKFNQIGQNPGFVPSWSDKPLLKSWEKTKPPLGWPRETDSL